MSDHTPGPWMWKYRSGAGLEIYAPVKPVAQQNNDQWADRMSDKSLIYQLPEGSYLQHLVSYEVWKQFPVEWWDKMQTANARLIAASPDLYAAAKTALENLEHIDDPHHGYSFLAIAVNALKAAVEKVDNGPEGE